jgi:hypothetical protein
LEAWRRRRTRREIPDEIWRQATELARRHGVHATAKALRLDYYSLRRRVGEPVATATRGSGPVPTFVEIDPVSSSSECTIDIEDPRGTKVRIQIKGAVPRELAALAQTLLGRA